METFPDSSSGPVTIPSTRPPKVGKPAKLRHRPTKETLEKRITTTARLISRGYYDVDVITLMVEWIRKNERDHKDQPVEVERGTIRNYLTRAKTKLRDQLGISKDEWKDRGLATCLDVIQSSTASHKDRLLAQRIINDMLGLDAPKYIHQKVDATLGVTVQEIFGNPAVERAAREIEQELVVQILDDTNDNGNGAHSAAGSNGGSLPS